LDYEKSVSTGAHAKISTNSFLPFSTVSVNFCRAISRNARLLYPTKLPHQRFAVEAITGQISDKAHSATILISTSLRRLMPF
jgi:hypothetical protein